MEYEIATSEKVNELIKEIFGKKFDGRFTKRVIVLDSDYPLTLVGSNGLEFIARNYGSLGGSSPIGYFQEKDGWSKRRDWKKA